MKLIFFPRVSGNKKKVDQGSCVSRGGYFLKLQANASCSSSNIALKFKRMAQRNFLNYNTEKTTKHRNKSRSTDVEILNISNNCTKRKLIQLTVKNKEDSGRLFIRY